MNDMEVFSGSVLRVFEAHAKPGCAEWLVEKFRTTSIDVVLGQSGNQGYFLGRQVSEQTDVVVFVSIWKDLKSIKDRFGDEWESSHLPPGYAEKIEDCSVKHIVMEKDWNAMK